MDKFDEEKDAPPDACLALTLVALGVGWLLAGALFDVWLS